MDEIDVMDALKYGLANPMSREQAIRLLTKIIAKFIEAGHIQGDAEELAIQMVDKREQLSGR